MTAPNQSPERYARLSALREEGGYLRLFLLGEDGPLHILAGMASPEPLLPGDWIAYAPTGPLGSTDPQARQPTPDSGTTLYRVRRAVPSEPVVSRAVPSGPVVTPTHPQFEGGDAGRWHQTATGRHGGVLGTRMELLRFRHRLTRAIRAHFDGQGFLEAETPALVTAPSPEPVFEPVPAEGGFLATSPEFQLKRMLVGGFQRVYRLGPVFRGREVGAHHNPEFTLLEWYRAFEDSTALIGDLQRLLVRLGPLALEFADGEGVAAGERRRLVRLAEALTALPYPVQTVAECFREQLGMEIGGITTARALHQAVREAGIGDADALAEYYREDFTGLFSALWIRVEAGFGPEPRFVTEWPAPTASLARLKPGDPTVAERVELYAGGLELANGFAELTDPVEQRSRFEADLSYRVIQGLPPVPLDEAFLRALEEGMPPAAGMALGVDRLVMLLSGASDIRDVLPFAWQER